MDADSDSTEARHTQLKLECNNQQIPPRSEKDHVLEIIPRRNIETWLKYLEGLEVEESKLYPKLNRESDCRKHAKHLYDMCHTEQKLREPAPPSLLEACEEYRKLKR